MPNPDPTKSNLPRLELHIPEPPSRPGEEVTFAHVNRGEAGAVRRPDIAVHESEVRDLPYELIRVLDDDDKAVGPWDPKLAPETLIKGLRAMMLTRAFDDRLFRAHRQGKTSFYMKSTGEEAIAAAQSMALDKGDMFFPTYRASAWLHARNYPLTTMCNQIFSNAEDPLAGKQLPILFSARDYDFYSISGNLGVRFVHAVGWAMASAYKNDTKISLAYVGDGTTAEGDFHEAMTFAAAYRAPTILCVTNNQYAISSFAGFAAPERLPFAAKALAYGFPGIKVDGNDFLAVWGATQWAAERARTNNGPTLIEFYTYRAEGHSTSDDPSAYRPKDEAAHWPLGDPVDRLKKHLIVLGAWDEDKHTALEAELKEQVKVAVKEAEAVGTLGQSKPPIEEMFEDVFAEKDWRLKEQERDLKARRAAREGGAA
ncbi:thiamine pyrophosphate-dependent enzyme [Croceicoccus naphthovorans]|uniref:2-oxoisovalerate dehydrogenase subunit alpha n=1 Tax=Croceicoccus naphthovorans TaxID=1348774 RepID=A0A0G3XCM5_9SPHN|nr:thiamine pyrophosphate-dependent enzyme [Croceicoccus naphthovorans]AKM08942.1 2-oxoisovalerate dehydrogenase [Croceicoccus naphthovorans]MBB3989269.1 2-oxoisovalerate dehydrogenase E1 component alpha subunit [Croceicoccus naphthovorans]